MNEKESQSAKQKGQMTDNENIVYANVVDVFENCVNSMRNDIARAFEEHAVHCEKRNPMYIGIANDVVAAALRCALKKISPNVGSGEDAMELSEQMFHSFISPEKEMEFITEVFKKED